MRTLLIAGQTHTKISLLLAVLFAAGLSSSQAQDTWTQKANFQGGERAGAAGFSIGSKGYIGTGVGYGFVHNDFWEYDPATDVWTQKADVGGPYRMGAVGFSIGSKGYIGTGFDGEGYHLYNDFWEYDPGTNTWTQKANFGGGARLGAIGFSIGDKGYIGTGANGGCCPYNYHNDFWEYDPAADTWSQKANFAGTARDNAVGFSIGGNGYIGTGYGNGFTNDFWKYDPATNTWSQKAAFGGSARDYAIGFSIGSKGYIGTGRSNYFTNDLWEYDPSADAWTQKADFGGTARDNAIGFFIGSKGYIGVGYDYSEPNDFWEYTPGTSYCVVPSNLSVTNITSSSAKLKWDAVTGAEGYKVRYKVANTNAWIKKNVTGTSKIIHGLLPNTNYKWEVKTYCQIDSPSISSDWSAKQDFTTTLRMGDESLQQISFQIYPNPAQDHATLQYTLPQSSHVSIKVYDVSGKEITTLLNDDMEQGDHSLLLNTNQFSKGVYLLKMISDFGMENQKLIVQ